MCSLFLFCIRWMNIRSFFIFYTSTPVNTLSIASHSKLSEKTLLKNEVSSRKDLSWVTFKYFRFYLGRIILNQGFQKVEIREGPYRARRLGAYNFGKMGTYK